MITDDMGKAFLNGMGVGVVLGICVTLLILPQMAF
jgi:gas vesicle protein